MLSAAVVIDVLRVKMAGACEYIPSYLQVMDQVEIVCLLGLVKEISKEL